MSYDFPVTSHAKPGIGYAFKNNNPVPPVITSTTAKEVEHTTDVLYYMRDDQEKTFIFESKMMDLDDELQEQYIKNTMINETTEYVQRSLTTDEESFTETTQYNMNQLTEMIQVTESDQFINIEQLDYQTTVANNCNTTIYNFTQNYEPEDLKGEFNSWLVLYIIAAIILIIIIFAAILLHKKIKQLKEENNSDPKVVKVESHGTNYRKNCLSTFFVKSIFRPNETSYEV